MIRAVSKLEKKKTREKKVKNQGFFDYSLFFVVLFLVCFGLVMIYSTSSYSAQMDTGNSYYYLTRQSIFAVIGIFAFLCQQESLGDSDEDAQQHFNTNIALIALFVALVALVKG